MRDERQNSSGGDAGTAWYVLMQELVMEFVESSVGRVWGARTWACMEVWADLLAAGVSLHLNSVPPCRLPETGGGLMVASLRR